jgi:hypothetical protein
VIATYAAVLAVCGASLAIGQAAFALCGVWRWTWLSPAVGLALLCAICWATTRLPGHGVVAAIAVLFLAAASVLFLWGRVEGGGEALRAGLPVAVAALAAASLPFAVEGHFGILGTGFNPDVSQHLLAADRLADGSGSQLLRQGYPLGPHAVVVALDKGLGIGLVQGFSGLTVAVAVLAPLTALAAFAGQPPLRRAAEALLVGLPYLVASYYAQGAFKETIQALLVLAFALALRESARSWRDLPLRFVPAALIAIGSVYVYSFPGLAWLAAIAVVWAALKRWGKSASAAGGVGEGVSPEERRPVLRPSNSASKPSSSGEKPSDGGDAPSPATGPAAGTHDPARGDTPSPATGPARLRALSLALLVFFIGTLPELGRMIDFHSFETFDPSGPGLGNLFGQISPLEALGIWPSGDFRVAPGDGAAPAVLYYLGAAFATVLLLYGLARCIRRRERAILAAAIAVAALYVAARVGGTPYTAAKALEVATPILTLTILLPLSHAASPAGGVGEGVSPEERRPVFRPSDSASETSSSGEKPSDGGDAPSPATGPAGLVLWVYILAAAACSLLAFANTPVGPTSYSPALTGLRPLFASDSVLVLAPDDLLADRHGAPYIAWELRGGQVCVEPASSAGGRSPAGIRFFVTSGAGDRPPFRGLRLRRRAGPYLVWERPGVLGGPSPCPLIVVRQARAASD